jgi:hypothetical protein
MSSSVPIFPLIISEFDIEGKKGYLLASLIKILRKFK